METSGFFNAKLVNGKYDKEYFAEDFASYFANFVTDGVFGGSSDQVQVLALTSPSMNISVNSGRAFIKGYWYKNVGPVEFPIDIADGVLDRIDVIVLRLNFTDGEIKAAVKKGTPSSSPSAPTLQRDEDFWELKLAEIRINHGITKITQSEILDTRLNKEVCGIVSQFLDELDPTTFFLQIEAKAKELEQAIKDIVAGTDSMLKTEYDTNRNGVVDNSEQVGGFSASQLMKVTGGNFTGEAKAFETATSVRALKNNECRSGSTSGALQMVSYYIDVVD